MKFKKDNYIVNIVTTTKKYCYKVNCKSNINAIVYACKILKYSNPDIKIDWVNIENA